MISGLSWLVSLQVARHEDIRREQDHVLLAAAEGHLQQAVQPVDGLAQHIAGERHECACRAVDGIGWDGRVTLRSSPGVSTRFSISSRCDAFRLDEQILDDGVRARASRGP